MDWHLAAYFVAGAMIANGVPHFYKGISGQRFQTPFASPPGLGESSAMTNVLFGLSNFVIGYLLIYGLGDFQIGMTIDALAVWLGVLVAAVLSAWFFAKTRVDRETKKGSSKKAKKRGRSFSRQPVIFSPI